MRRYGWVQTGGWAREAGLTPQRRTEIETELRQAGVPPDVISYVMKGHLIEWYTTAHILVYCSFFFPIAVISLFFIRFFDNHARDLAKARGAILYMSNDGLWLIIALFATMFLIAAAVAFLFARTPNLQINYVVFTIVDRKKQRLSEWVVDWGIRRLRHVTDPARYVRKAVWGSLAMMGVPGLLLGALSAYVAVREWRSFEAFTPTVYIDEPFFPWNAAETHEWSSAVSVTIGCKHSWRRGGGASDDLIYTVTFADGAEAHLGSATPVRGSWLDAMEVIDRAILRSRPRFLAWKGSKEAALDPRCIDAVYERFPGDEFERLKTVMKWVES